MTHRKLGNGMYFLLWLIVAIVFMAANRIDTKRYKPYEMLVWEIKANEGYRSWWYPDGKTSKGAQKYSIGFGWNDLGGIRRHEIRKYTADGKVTYDEAMKITLAEISKWGKFSNDPYVNLAMQLYSYNCGRIDSPSKLGSCHNGRNAHGKRCGYTCSDKRKQANVRRAHNRRREYEMALKNHDWSLIQEYTEYNRSKVINLVIKLKKGG